MKLENLSPCRGAKKRRKRVGRGLGSGHGVTATRGTKGQKARSGGGKGPSFEGGQTPIQRRLPGYPGFKNIFKVKYMPVNIEQLNVFSDGEEVTLDMLVAKKIIKKSDYPVKLLSRGELKVKLKSIQVHAASKNAREKIEKSGGKVEIVS